MPSIVDNVNTVLKEQIIPIEDINTVKLFLEASKMYEDLVSTGFAKKRGNNLLSLDKIYSAPASFNVNGFE